MRKTTFDQLQSTSYRVAVVDRQQQMHVVRHDDVFVQEEFTFVAITYDRGQ